MGSPLRVLLPLVLVLAFLPQPALAGCVPHQDIPEVDTGDLAGRRFYVDHDICQPECAANVWVYEESNGIPGMQRSDFQYDNTCGGMIPADTFVAVLYARGTGA